MWKKTQIITWNWIVGQSSRQNFPAWLSLPPNTIIQSRHQWQNIHLLHARDIYLFTYIPARFNVTVASSTQNIDLLNGLHCVTKAEQFWARMPAIALSAFYFYISRECKPLVLVAGQWPLQYFRTHN